MRTLLENWQILAVVVALAALASDTAHAQAPARTANDSSSDAPRSVGTPRVKGTAKVGTPAKPAGNGSGTQGSGQQGAGQPAAGPQGAAPQADHAPMAPFKLSPAEEELLDEVLKPWEERNAKIKTFKCTFQRWEYDTSLAADLANAQAELAKPQAESKTDSKAALPKADADRVAALQLLVATLQRVQKAGWLRSEASGVIKYKPPDQGMFRVTKLGEFDPNTKRAPKDPILTEVKENLEHWVCDGKAIHEFTPPVGDQKGKHLIHVIPPQMQGEAIADGPVPFIFGAKIDKLKARYWLREATPKEEQGQRIWLEVYPKFQHDAANFRRVKVMLKADDHSLYAMMIELPSGKQQTVFRFNDIVINDFFGGIKGDFDPPKTPRGWERIIDPPAVAPTANKPAAQAADKREASRKPAPPAAVR